MKKIRIFFMTLFWIHSATVQSCLPNGIIFSSQSQIDNFQNNYPSCTQIEGFVRITGYDITNLIGLNVLTSIEGNLLVENNSNLTSLMGLNNITSIGDGLYVNDNDALTSLIGLDNLTSIGGEFWIVENKGLTNFQGLNSLTFVGGLLIINYNNSLTSIADLNSLSSVGGSFIIAYNAALSSLTGLNALTSIGGDLQIIGNYSLISLSGLDNLETNSIADLYIKENYSLSTCHVQSICNYLANPNGSILIYDNATGCNSQYEVEFACGVGIEQNSIFENYFIFYPNPTSTNLIIETDCKGLLSILNLNNQEITMCQITEHKTLIDISYLPRGVYIIRFQNENSVQTRKLIKQ